MIETLISSKTRIKLLLKFFLNPTVTAYLRGLEAEFGESTNAIRIELNKLEDAGMLTSQNDGNRKVYHANKNHPLFNDINSILRKYTGIDKIIENVIKRVGDIKYVFISGNLARGMDSDIIDLIFCGDNIDETYLHHLVKKAEGVLNKKIRYIQYSQQEYNSGILFKNNEPHYLIWEQ